MGAIGTDECVRSNLEGHYGKLLTQLHDGEVFTHQKALRNRHWGLPETE